MVNLIDSGLHQKIQQLYSICSNCGECSLSCPSHFVGIFNPMGVLRKLQMDGVESAIKTELLYNCLTCNRCMVFCPNSGPDSGMDFAKLILYLRQYNIQNGIAPIESLATSENAILYSQTDNLIPLNNISMIKSSANLKFEKQGSYAFFMGDLVAYQEKFDNLSINWTEIAVSSITILNQVQISPVILDMYGSGHDDYWHGNLDVVKKIAEDNSNLYSNAGVTCVVCEDAESYYMWKRVYPQFVLEFNFQVLHLSEVLLEENRIRKLSFDVPLAVKYTYQDVSRIGRMGGNLYDPPRSVLITIPKLTLVELDNNRDDAYDLSCGIHLEHSEKVLQMWKNRFSEILDAEVQYFITTSPKSLITIENIKKNHPDLIENIEKMPSSKDWAVFLSRFLY